MCWLAGSISAGWISAVLAGSVQCWLDQCSAGWISAVLAGSVQCWLDQCWLDQCWPDQAAGPVVRVTVEVCDWPLWSTQVILIESPGWYLTSTCEMSLATETDWPPTEVISSPAARPALPPGEPDRTPPTVHPARP